MTAVQISPAPTYFVRIRGNKWRELGVLDNDVALVNRSLRPSRQDVVMWLKDGDVRLSVFDRLPKGARVWGVVTTAIHQYTRAWQAYAWPERKSYDFASR